MTEIAYETFHKEWKEISSTIKPLYLFYKIKKKIFLVSKNQSSQI